MKRPYWSYLQVYRIAKLIRGENVTAKSFG